MHARFAIFTFRGALDDCIEEFEIYSETNCDGLVTLGGSLVQSTYTKVHGRSEITV